jgi:membrane-associated phospholipid phosphatase
MNFTDLTLMMFFMLASILISAATHRVWNWSVLIVVNLLCLAVIGGIVAARKRSRVWQFLHDWFPMGMFIVCFEEVSRLSFVLRDSWQDQYLLALEGRFFAVPPTVWLAKHSAWWITEIVEVGYFSYFVLLMIVGGVFYAARERLRFREVMDTTTLAYVICYAIFILFPTEGPAHTLAEMQQPPIPGGGPFHWAVRLIQSNAGVHGNAFPSAHVAGAVVALYFAWKYRQVLGAALTPLVALLCVGAVYDRYHYVSDVVGGLVVGLAAVSCLRIVTTSLREDDNGVGEFS